MTEEQERSDKGKKDAGSKAESNSDLMDGRRNFLKVAITLSILFLVGGIVATLKAITSRAPPPGYTAGATLATIFPRVKVASLHSLQANNPVIFNYPLDNEPNILVKMGEKAEGGAGPDGDIVAFSQICQHLGCYYNFYRTGEAPPCDPSYEPASPVGFCCCHGGIYDFLRGGRVIGGPPPRPVPQVRLEVDSSGDIYAVGMGSPTVFGHNTGSDDVTYDLQGGSPVET